MLKLPLSKINKCIRSNVNKELYRIVLYICGNIFVFVYFIHYFLLSQSVTKLKKPPIHQLPPRASHETELSQEVELRTFFPAPVSQQE